MQKINIANRNNHITLISLFFIFYDLNKYDYNVSIILKQKEEARPPLLCDID